MADSEGGSPKPKVIFGHKTLAVDKPPRRLLKEKERVLYPRHLRAGCDLKAVVGRPITEEEALEVRQIVFGTSSLLPRGEWLKAGILMREQNMPLAYGIKSQRNTTRGLLTVVQAHIIRQLLFVETKSRNQLQETPMRLLMPNEQRQTEVLWMALADILWIVGEKRRVCFALPGPISHIPVNQEYIPDGCTEKLKIYEYTTLEEVQFAVKRAISQFQDEFGFGCLILLYSAVFTRGLSKLREDLEPETLSLISAVEEGSLSIVMLLLTGRATSSLHNGIVYVGDEDNYALPQFGVLSRSEIGFLLWEDAFETLTDESKIPGSRLKTPSVPVWVVNCNGHYGVLFNTNKELLRNYHAERRFELHHYTCGGTYNLLNVDTRFAEPEQNETGNPCKIEEIPSSSSSINPLEKLIHTKWQDAHITWLENSTVI